MPSEKVSNLTTSNTNVVNNTLKLDLNVSIQGIFQVQFVQANQSDAVKLRDVNLVPFSHNLSLTTTICAFSHYETAPPIAIPMRFSNDIGYTPQIYRHVDQKITELFPLTVPACNFSNIALVTDVDGTPLDVDTGLGIISYDSGDDILILDEA
jgi:hypothetical protein